VETVHMNAEDMDIAKRWNDDGFVGFGRIANEDLNQTAGNYWCHLSQRAWENVAAERMARAVRTWEKKNWKTTAEKKSLIGAL